MNNRSDRPGYGYQLKKGATALTESWAALPEHSNNHMMLGHLMEWFYTGLGGIHQDKASIAYDKIIIAPKPVGDIQYVDCSYKSVKGLIKSVWKIEEGQFNLRIVIPKQTTAKVIIPDKFKSAAIQVRSLVTEEIMKVQVDNGVFDINEGEYEILAN